MKSWLLFLKTKPQQLAFLSKWKFVSYDGDYEWNIWSGIAICEILSLKLGVQRDGKVFSCSVRSFLSKNLLKSLLFFLKTKPQ